MTLQVKVVLPCVLVGGKVKEYDYNGKKGLNYSLAIICNDEAINLPCTPDVIDMIKGLELYTKVYLHGDYDTTYKRLKVTSLDYDLN